MSYLNAGERYLNISYKNNGNSGTPKNPDFPLPLCVVSAMCIYQCTSLTIKDTRIRPPFWTTENVLLIVYLEVQKYKKLPSQFIFSAIKNYISALKTPHLLQ